jgi:hypothetical protein
MKNNSESASKTLVRSIAIGILLSILFFYCIHVFGTWRVENYRPDPETTSTILLHNNCLIFNKIHTLRPNTDISKMDNSIDGTKLGGSFMNFFDGHIGGMLIFSLLLGGIIFFFWSRIKKNHLAKQVQ